MFFGELVVDFVVGVCVCDEVELILVWIGVGVF